MRTIISLAAALSLFGLVTTSTAQAQTCVGDCGGVGAVGINDLILGVNIALGLQPTSACPAFQNSEGEVDIAQLIKGVGNALNGCQASQPTATATATATGTAQATITATGTPIASTTETVAVATPTATPTETGAIATATETPAQDLCGNSILDAGEQCDPVGGPCGAGTLCQSDCTCPCDFLDTSECLFPFPSDYLSTADASTDSGRRVHFAVASMPRNVSNTPIEPSDYNLNDGFSPGVTMLLHVPGVDLTITGAAPITDMARSLEADAPVVLINASTLAHHLMWTELDANATSEPKRALILHPGVNLAEGTRYIVALRRMKDSSGALIQPAADFLAYRDGTGTGAPFKEARRPHMEEIFTTLDAAGIERSDLYLAWDFTVASERNLTERMLFVRDDGFARLGAAAPNFTVTQVENDVDGNIFRRVTGTYDVERYVDSVTPPARFVLGADGLPVHQATPQVASFICNIPRAALAGADATAAPARGSIYGHGLLGSNDEVNGGNVKAMSNEHNFVFCATKWIGMSEDDVGTAVAILQDLGKFPALTDRLQQSMLNQLYLARLMIHPQGFVSNPAFQDTAGGPVIDTSAVFYDGNSQGGIFGGTVIAISQDITRGVLGVPGMNYSLLLTRSTDFAGYSALLYPAYPNEFHRPLGLALIQMLWDRSDPNGYAHHMTTDPLPNTPPHTVLLHQAFGDHQVANIATEIEARTIGASIHQPAIAAGRNPDVVPYYGIAAIPSDPFDGSALIVWDSGAVTPPITNTAPSMGDDPHSDPRNSPVARQQKSDFLKSDGAVVDVCSGSPCVAP
ncbi:MAG: hypothetical protein ABI629_04640 [bacterium]